MEKTVEFYDIYDYIYIPVWQTRPFKIGALIVIFLLVLIGAFLLYRYLKKRNTLKRQLTPWEWALKELQILNPRTCTTKKDFKIFYFTLTSLIKNYLLKRYGWNIQEKTDAELIDFLTRKKIEPSLTAIIEGVLNGALLIKFADAQTLLSQAEKDLAALISFIEQTIPHQPQN